ncbi:MAG: alpha/beta hydrolase, partial [Quisquiliibacterium sp.]
MPDIQDNRRDPAGIIRHLISTPDLEVEYFAWGNPGKRPILLLHGWPDCPLTWSHLAQALAADNWWPIAPSLRGFGATRFKSPDIPRSGQFPALSRDAIGLLDALDIKDPIPVIGHDWGARASYVLSCLWPDRIRACVAMSVGWGTNRPDQPLSMSQASRYWYHWFMHTARGRQTVANNRREFTRFLWQLWSPNWQFSDQEFAATAEFFDNPDWAEVTVHSYTHRWAGAPGDPAHQDLEQRLANAPLISVPTLMLHGDDDRVTEPSSSENR